MEDLSIFESSSPGQTAYSLPPLDVPAEDIQRIIPPKMLRKEVNLPELSELEVVRHFTRLSQKNFSVDTHFYPLGSCTMKYNPKANEEIAKYPGFTDIHPLQDEAEIQGALELLYDFEKYLCAIFGYDAFTLQPAAGAHGELTALMMIKAFHKSRVASHGSRGKIIIPDSSHGTNPASVAMVGYEAVVVKSNGRGNIDIDALKKIIGDDTAGLMLTNPNTLGLFDEHILEVADIVHKAGGLLYYDGANANANLGICRPADLGFDVAHFNLHKTFSTPHGGGGPGSGPVGVNKKLEPFLPVPRIVKTPGGFTLSDDKFPMSIGRVHSFHGNVNVIVKAYAYIRSLGADGLRKVSEKAVENANYMMGRLKEHYWLPYDRTCQHEFVISAKWQKEKYGIKALDIAKRLIDYGFHPPTIYFPLIVEEALMIEPTESESGETIAKFCDALLAIAKECEKEPELVKSAPHHTPVRRLDETKAVREPNLRWLLVAGFACLLCLSSSALTYEVVSIDNCRFLGYSSEKKQTDHDPFSTASGTEPKWGTVAANHLPLWTRIKIQGFREKIFVVEDRMHSRYNRTIDIWFPSKKEARKFGVRRLKYWVLKNVRPLPD